jgi:hypothetical protein
MRHKNANEANCCVINKLQISKFTKNLASKVDFSMPLPLMTMSTTQRHRRRRHPQEPLDSRLAAVAELLARGTETHSAPAQLL